MISGLRHPKKIWFASVLLILAAFTDFGLAVDNQRLAEEDDIREAVFRYQFQHNGSGQRQSAHAYCLSIVVNDKHVSGRFPTGH